MIWFVVIVIGVVYFLSTSGEAADVSILGLKTPVITETPVVTEPEPYSAPVQNGIPSYEEPVSTFQGGGGGGSDDYNKRIIPYTQ